MTSSITSSILKLNWRDLLNGLFVAVLGAIIGVVQGGNFDVFTADWTMIGKLAVNAAVSFLIIKLFADSKGQTFGKI